MQLRRGGEAAARAEPSSSPPGKSEGEDGIGSGPLWLKADPAGDGTLLFLLLRKEGSGGHWQQQPEQQQVQQQQQQQQRLPLQADRHSMQRSSCFLQRRRR